MRSFRTIVDIPESKHKIDHSSKIMFIGSCFSDSIGQKLVNSKFRILINPFGVLYNPGSISKSLNIITNKTLFSVDDLNFYNEQWFSFFHHSSFSNHDKNICLNQINSKIEASHEHLKNASFLFITLGTSYVYTLADGNQIVSNCHKLPSKEFKRKRLSVDEIVVLLSDSLEKLEQLNPKLKVVFTISPIRHWKDGAHGNQISKSTLFLAVEKLINLRKTTYFPSYEIIMDELRDYRFYESDMLHISDLAIDYIFDGFADCYFSSETKKTNRDIEKIQKAKNHKAFNPKANNYLSFLESNIISIEKIENQHIAINFADEKKHFTSEIEKYF